MAGEEIPEDVTRFLDGCIDSVEQLRVLLLLHQNPQKSWSTAEITAELRSADSAIAKRLDDLYARKVLERQPALHGRHQFTPATEELRVVIGELARVNQLRPYRIIDAIYSRPDKALQDFANAFKLRGDKK